MVISVKNLNKTFNVPAGRWLFLPKWKKAKVLKNINFAIRKGEFVALLGPNGAGKTTTTKILSGVLVPDEGSEVSVLGYTPWQRKEAFLKRIGVLFGNRSALEFDVPAMDTLLLFKEIYELDEKFFKKRVKFLSTLLGAEQLLEMPVRKMSFGQRMRVELLATFLHKPELVLLDEPTIGLDPVVKNDVRRFLRKINELEKTTIILTTHNIQDVEYLCERSLLLKNGELVWDGPTAELKEKYATFKHVEAVVARVKNKRKASAVMKKYKLKDTENVLRGKISRKQQIAFVRDLLSAYQLASLNIREPELEEILYKLYNE